MTYHLKFLARTNLLLLAALLLVAPVDGAQRYAARLPPPGIAAPADVRGALEEKLKRLQSDLAEISDSAEKRDAAIFEKAVRYALEYNEFYRTNEFVTARHELEEGMRRVEALRQERTPWTTQTGLVVRAYQSRVDGSLQPYGLVVPASYRPGDGKRYRLDVWLHGRDETLTELKFIQEHSSRAGEFTPPDTFVLHPYGRYCNAFKFAGEIDVLEGIEAAEAAYPIDASRVALRGFSMGGAGVWHLAVHYADRWVCASPGAGFAETARYMKLMPDAVPAHERTLWQWYDATDYALNLFNTPVVAYSGELDKQKQAADIMAAALADEGLPLIHLIGPKTEHRYELETKKIVAAAVDTFARMGRPNPPPEVRLTTRTLRYSRMHWLQLLGLGKHWARADAWVKIDGETIRANVTNVTSFAIDLSTFPALKQPRIVVNGNAVAGGIPDATGKVVLSGVNGTWSSTAPKPGGKSPGLQGPIDDAFMDSFVFVIPTGKGFHSKTSQWIESELKRAAHEWRAQFRGDARVVKDSELTAAEIERSNLVLWGDPGSNSVLARVLPQLAIKWTVEKVELGSQSFDGAKHVPLMIQPNPLNPRRYVVLNSGFTFRGFGSNAGQTPKLPDYAIVDITAANPFEKIVGGFFDEKWEVAAE